jgi:hypothetical protein
MAEYAAQSTNGTELGEACGRYRAMEQARRPFLDRARQCAELTLPYLIPPEGWTGQQQLYTPFQSIGSRGTNHLTSKLMLTLFPPNSPFSRLMISGKAKDEAKAGDPKLLSKIEEALAEIDRKIASEVETLALRPHFAEAIRHLIVGGNILLYFPEDHDDDGDENVRVFHLNKYVVKRDPSGNLLEMVVKECVSPKALDESYLAAIKEKVSTAGDDKTLDLYTYVKRSGDEWEVYQEIHGLQVPGSYGTYTKANFPWVALRWTKIDGEDYGRGFIEDHLGDLQSLEGLSQTIVEGSAAAAKLLFLVNPNGTTKIQDIEKAANGAIKQGNAADVTVLHVEKQADFQIAGAQAERIEKRLSFAFLLNSAAQRNGERVTAEEWRYMIQEIEDGLGGIYSVLAHELQLPLVKLLMARMTKQKKIKPLPKGSVDPIIVTGLEALGRGHDLEKIRSLMKDVGSLPPQVAQVVMEYFNVDELLTRLTTGAGIDPAGLVKDQDEIDAMNKQKAAAQQQAQMQEMIAKLGPAGIKAGADMMGQKGLNGPEAAGPEAAAAAGGGNQG